MQKCFEDIFPALHFVYFILTESGRVKESGFSSLSSSFSSPSSSLDYTVLLSGTFTFAKAEKDGQKDVKLAEEKVVSPFLMYPSVGVEVRGLPDKVTEKLRREKEKRKFLLRGQEEYDDGITLEGEGGTEITKKGDKNSRLPMSPLTLLDEGEGEGEGAFPLSFHRNFAFLTILKEGTSQIWTYNWGVKQVCVEGKFSFILTILFLSPYFLSLFSLSFSLSISLLTSDRPPHTHPRFTTIPLLPPFSLHQNTHTPKGWSPCSSSLPHYRSFC